MLMSTQLSSLIQMGTTQKPPSLHTRLRTQAQASHWTPTKQIQPHQPHWRPSSTNWSHIWKNLTINHTMDSVAHPQHWQPLGMLSEIYLQRPCLFLLYSISTQNLIIHCLISLHFFRSLHAFSPILWPV